MDMGLKEKHVLITGGSRGIGLACERAFAQEGARITIVSRQPHSVSDALVLLKAEHIEARGLHADLVDPEQATCAIHTIEHQWGPVDVLVNSAGAARMTPFAELTPAAWMAAMQNKFFTCVHMMDPLARLMNARGGGAIVNVIGMGGKVARTIHIAGGAANAALMLATAGMAAAYAPGKVRINAVNPGATLTERLELAIAADAKQRGITQSEARMETTQGLPIGRMAEPEEIADAVVYLASSRAGYLCGAILNMDGGHTPLI